MAKETFEAFRARFETQLYDEYDVKMRLKDVVGGTPADPEMISGWINATCKELSDEQRAKIVEASAAELPDVAEGVETRGWTRFKRDETGLYLEGRQVKAGLKEAANIIKTTLTTPPKSKAKGIAALKHKFAETVFVIEERIYLRRNGDVIKEAPHEERPIHVMTAQGPRTSLKRTDVLRDVEIEFRVRVAKTGAVTQEALYAALLYLEQLGLGADRSQGHGQSTVVSVELRD